MRVQASYLIGVDEDATVGELKTKLRDRRKDVSRPFGEITLYVGKKKDGKWMKSSEVARVTLGKLSKSIKAVMSESNKMDSKCRARDYGSPRCVIVNHSECIKCRFREEHLKAMPPGEVRKVKMHTACTDCTNDNLVALRGGTTRRMVQGLTRGVGKSLQAMRKEEAVRTTQKWPRAVGKTRHEQLLWAPRSAPDSGGKQVTPSHLTLLLRAPETAALSQTCILQAVDGPGAQAAYKFVLKRMIGRFLAADELDLDQLDVHLRSGRLELCDLLLNAEVLNAELCEAQGLPFKVKKGYLGSVRVAISYANIMSESCLVEIDDIEIILVPLEKDEAQTRQSYTEPEEKEQKQEKEEKKPMSPEPVDEISQEGLDFVASWIEQVTSKIKVTLSNICLRLETGEQHNGRDVALLCKLQWAQFTDESVAEVQSVYGRSSLDHSAGMYGSQTMAGGVQSMAATVHYEALEAPAMDADVFFHSIRVVLQPQYFPELGKIVDAFSTDPAKGHSSGREAAIIQDAEALAAESVESIGLSDLEDEEDGFFECETGLASSIAPARYGFDENETEGRRDDRSQLTWSTTAAQNRAHVESSHVLNFICWSASVSFCTMISQTTRRREEEGDEDSLSGREDEGSMTDSRFLRAPVRPTKSLPSVDGLERLELSLKDIIFSSLAYSQYSLLAFTIGKFTITEKTLPRMSLDAEEDESAMLSTSLLEEDTSASKRNAASAAHAEAKEFAKTFDMTTECVQMTLRFPMVNSDLIRFGPSSKRGLCEDRLLMTLESVKVASYSPREGDEAAEARAPMPPQYRKGTSLPWLAEFDASFGNAKSPDGASVGSSPDEVSGDDNDGGRVGLNGWNLDALGRAESYESAAAAASLYSVEIGLPRANAVLFKSSLDRLMVLFDALLMINPIDVDSYNQMLAAAALRNRLMPSYMSMNLTLGEGTVRICDYVSVPPSPSSQGGHASAVQETEEKATDESEKVLFTYHFAFQTLKVFQVSHLRYDVRSKWLFQMLDMVLMEYPIPIIPLDSASMSDEESTKLFETVKRGGNYDAVPLATAPKTVFTKLFVNFYDVLVDYAPLTLTSRLILVLGKVNVSSNVVTGAVMQGYKISVGDLELFLTQTRAGYEEIDDVLLGNDLFLRGNAKNSKKKTLKFAATCCQCGPTSSIEQEPRDTTAPAPAGGMLAIGTASSEPSGAQDFSSTSSVRSERLSIDDSGGSGRGMINILEQIDEDAFGGGKKIFPGKTVATDTEARLLRTRMDSIQREKERMVHGLEHDDQLSASELRLRYQQEERRKSAKPVRINELVIEDYYAKNRSFGGLETSRLDPWFSSAPTNPPSMGSSPDKTAMPYNEHAARWLAPGGTTSNAGDGTPKSEVSGEDFPLFEPVEEKAPAPQPASVPPSVGQATIDYSSDNAYDLEDEDEVDDFDANHFPWAHSQLHQRTGMDDGNGNAVFPNTMSMSIIDAGEDEGKEIELDFGLDGDLQSQFNRILDMESNNDQEVMTITMENVGILCTKKSNKTLPYHRLHERFQHDRRPFHPPVAILVLRRPRLHVLLRNFNICMRFFGGCDWTRDASDALRLHPPKDAHVEDNLKGKQPDSATAKKEKLLDALLDNYVPSDGGDLFGNDGSSALFTTAKSAPTTSFMKRDPATRTTRAASSDSTPSRKRSLKKSGRKTEEMLELVVTRIQLRLDMFNEAETQSLASHTVLALGDVELLDYISTSQIRKIICYWKSEATHPRESGSSMMRLQLITVRPGPNLCEEHRLKARLLPLRINLDQEVVKFLRQFVPTEETPAPKKRLARQIRGMEMKPIGESAPAVEAKVSLGAWFFQSIDIKPCKIKIDYRPNHVDYAALRAGDYLEVINLFVLEGMELVLRRVQMSGLDGWAAMGENVLVSWVQDISRRQIHKCVASVSMPPLRPFVNVGAGAADLILLPMEH
ncbi:Vacuolar protein sorting-associated protein 13, N-terminal domain [Phytophthora cactorum]|nr:Vacuolar protein sorting-associated protein 13, N-terminal domain [Phytophthora cactorum]